MCFSQEATLLNKLIWHDGYFLLMWMHPLHCCGEYEKAADVLGF